MASLFQDSDVNQMRANDSLLSQRMTERCVGSDESKSACLAGRLCGRELPGKQRGGNAMPALRQACLAVDMLLLLTGQAHGQSGALAPAAQQLGNAHARR